MTPEEFARKAGLVFDDPGLLMRALTHRSYVNEHPDALEDNERLEFLGDAVLDFISANWLYNRFPEMDEGQLTRLRSSLVCTEQLGRFASEIGLGEALMLGQGEHASGGRERPALLCDAFEALVGALYLDGGFERVRAYIEPRFEEVVGRTLDTGTLVDARSQLQMWAQAEIGATPEYDTLETTGPDHAREFLVSVSIRSKEFGRGRGRSKQEAAQNAAADALRRVDDHSVDLGGV
jgi:ribonuclease-3